LQFLNLFMSQTSFERVVWTSADLELLPDNGNYYEIIDGELFVTRAPHWQHQKVCGRIYAVLDAWSLSNGLGEASITPGIVFSDTDNVIPDVVWVSKERLALLLDKAGHLTAAPELIVEVLSTGTENERRDREVKLKLYSVRGVREYWVVDWRKQQIEIYLRERAALKLVATLFDNDDLTSQLLPGFSYPVSKIFA
jgi:Uma2 family endonuclease